MLVSSPLGVSVRRDGQRVVGRWRSREWTEGRSLSEPKLLRELVDDGVRRIEAVINIGLRGNPASDAAVACMVGGSCSGRRVGPMTSSAAALHAVEFALDATRGEPTLVVTCNTYTTPTGIGHPYAAVSNRIVAKMGRSKVLFKRKEADRRFARVNEFARGILLSGDPIWRPNQAETRASEAARVETQAEAKIESPPESSVYVALRSYFTEPEAVRLDPDSPWWALPGFRGKHGVLIPQFKVGRYRADFGVLGHSRKLIVEVDGFTYHSSKEAFENDRRRDREMLLSGWLVMRFPASEATYEPQACAEQVIEALGGGA